MKNYSMPIMGSKLAIATLIAGLYVGSTSAFAADSTTISATPLTLTARAPDKAPTKTTVAPSQFENPNIEATDSAASDQPAIISIEPASPGDAAPLLKSTNSLGNPREDLWARIRVGFALHELDTGLVQENEKWYAKRPEYVGRMLERSKRYLFYIVQEVEKRGMPTEIALLPMIESAFNPKAYSTSHAAGIWQFIPATGRDYGLKQNWWVDNRRNVVGATNAALDYLQKLHDMFGSWELALAAYNWGEGSVSRAIAKNESQGLPTDYLSLHMPKETQQYVPRLIAIKNLIQHPQDFGVDLGLVPNAPYFAQITLTQRIDVALAAKLAETTLEEFTSLNPHYNRPVIQTSKGPTTLLLPVDKAAVFASNLGNYSKPLVSWQPYYAKRGEKLSTIASRHGLTAVRLKEVNGIALKHGRLVGNQVLLVPGYGGAKFENVAFSEIQAAPELRSNTEIYTVRKGDTLQSIAKHAGVKVTQIKTWNHLKSNRVALHQKIYFSPSDKTLKASRHTVAASAAKPRHYTVRRGDTLSSIAQRFDVEPNDLFRWNKLSSKKHLRPGDKVSLFAKNG
jgi:membrane-bound lytic murein transglycosylase D